MLTCCNNGFIYKLKAKAVDALRKEESISSLKFENE